MYILSFLELQEVRHAHKSVMVCDFLATVIGLVLWASIASGDSGLRIEIDAAAGIKIGVPSDFPASSKASKWEHSWSSTDGGVTLNSLAFEAGRSSEEIYARLTSIKGRSLTGNTGTAGGRFTLEGQDSDGQGFYIELHQDGDTVRGFSLIFAEARRNKYAPLIKRVASSFQLISASTPNSAPPALAAPVDCQAETDMLAGLARGSTVSMSAPPDLGGWRNSGQLGNPVPLSTGHSSLSRVRNPGRDAPARDVGFAQFFRDASGYERVRCASACRSRAAELIVRRGPHSGRGAASQCQQSYCRGI